MYRDIIKKNRYVRTLAFRYRNWRENRSFTSGSGHKIEKKRRVRELHNTDKWGQ